MSSDRQANLFFVPVGRVRPSRWSVCKSKCEKVLHHKTPQTENSPQLEILYKSLKYFEIWTTYFCKFDKYIWLICKFKCAKDLHLKTLQTENFLQLEISHKKPKQSGSNTMLELPSEFFYFVNTDNVKLLAFYWPCGSTYISENKRCNGYKKKLTRLSVFNT